MKNLFEPETVAEVLARIDRLEPTSPRQWGLMDVAQMMAHCSNSMDMASGRLVIPRLLIGRILGRFFKPVYTNEKPFSKDAPTARKLAIVGSRDFFQEQAKLKTKVRHFCDGGASMCSRHPHPFFGPLTPQEWARGSYKHLDHHLRQFGA
jgi:hypothetical protein